MGREVLEPSSAALQAAAKPSQLPAQILQMNSEINCPIPKLLDASATKKPDACDTGFFWGSPQKVMGVTSAMKARGDDSPVDKQTRRRNHVQIRFLSLNASYSLSLFPWDGRIRRRFSAWLDGEAD